MTQTQGQRSMPVLAVKDVDASCDFFVNGLGFVLAGKWQADNGVSSFAIVQLDQITVGLNYGDPKGPGGPWSAYFYVADIDAYAAQVQRNGVKLTRDVTDQFYGCRDMDVEDPDGNLLCFGQDKMPKKEGPGF